MSRKKVNAGILLALIGWMNVIIACFKPLWRCSKEKGQITWDGLWETCVEDSPEQRRCKAYNSVHPFPPDLQVSRNIIVIAISMTVLPLTLSIMGANCPSCIKNKMKVVAISGGFFFMAGCLVLIPVTWINTINQDLKEQELGESFKMSFGGACLLIIGGVGLCHYSFPQEERQPNWKCRITELLRMKTKDNRARKTSSTRSSNGIKIGGFTLGVIGWILAIGTCFLPMWRVTTSTGSPTYFHGLWMRCVMPSIDQIKCEVNSTMLNAPGHQTACVTTIISILVGLQALINFIMRKKGVFCFLYCKDSKIKQYVYKGSKVEITSLAGVLYIIAGFALVMPVSFFSTIQYSDKPDLNVTQRSELEASIYMGFAAAALLIIGGFLVCCSYLARKME
ncbi:hypothetical protein NFI96_022417 [Prochilodus magdalenae]|nr:hypothetical protein NFI96_022417 [Prochilodus magdalenae]